MPTPCAERGRVVRSKAGRDKQEFLVVVGMQESDYLLCDGRRRPLERPKRKKQMHIAPTNRYLSEAQLSTNKSLRRALREFSAAETSEGSD